jgi:hypothetical protein
MRGDLLARGKQDSGAGLKSGGRLKDISVTARSKQAITGRSSEAEGQIWTNISHVR